MPAEVSRLIRFGATGFVVAVIYVGGYTALYHSGLAPFLANLFAFGASVAVQYVLQTVWTFRRRLIDGAQGMRFLALIGMGLGYSSVVASLVGPALDLRPWVAAGFVAVTLPVLNYVAYRLWVYGPDMRAEDGR